MGLYGYAKGLFRQLIFHADPVRRLCISTAYIGFGMLVNFWFLQVFCRPVAWSLYYFELVIITVILMPWLLKQPVIACFASIICGAGVPMCLYCIIFLTDPWTGFREYIGFSLEILLCGLGLLAFIPVYLLNHIRRYYLVVKNGWWRGLFWIGCMTPLIAVAICLPKFRQSDIRLKHAMQFPFPSSAWRQVPRNYFTERLAGIGFKYHTKLEYVYDGWRPPLHDPFLNIYLWLYSDTYFPQWFVNRLAVYRKLFPGLPVWIDCPCSYTHDAMTYFDHDTSVFVR